MKVIKADTKAKLALLQARLIQLKLDGPDIRELIESEVRNRYRTSDQKKISKEITRRLKIQNKKLLEQVTRLKKEVKKTKEDKARIMMEANDLLVLNKGLADALGSCHLCWGENAECDFCKGNGSPGWKNINRRLFNLYVLPTLEKIYDLTSRIKLVK